MSKIQVRNGESRSRCGMISRCFVFLSLFLLSFASAAPKTVRLDEAKGILRDGKPYFIKGAGGEKHLQELVARGGNSIRTWGSDDLGKILPEAEKLHLTVSAGIWLEPECNWFSYHNPEHCKKQQERVKAVILQHKDQPALLAWGLGNEMEGDGKNAALWQQVNKLAEMVHEVDPAHPTYTAVAGLSPDKAAGLNEHAPKLDFVGINTYGALFRLREHLEKVGWKRPFVVTEYGPQGFWEIGKSPWGAPHEQTSAQKADMVRKAYAAAIAPGGQCLGAYVFVWGQKQEATSTWFGMFTKDGETVASMDALQEMWTGKGPENRAPDLTALASKAANQVLAPKSPMKVKVTATDPDQDPLTYRWQICQDEAKRGANGHELPAEILFTKTDAAVEQELLAPEKPGKYRVMVFALDGKGHAGTANFPIQVK